MQGERASEYGKTIKNNLLIHLFTLRSVFVAAAFVSLSKHIKWKEREKLECAYRFMCDMRTHHWYFETHWKAAKLRNKAHGTTILKWLWRRKQNKTAISWMRRIGAWWKNAFITQWFVLDDDCCCVFPSLQGKTAGGLLALVKRMSILEEFSLIFSAKPHSNGIHLLPFFGMQPFTFCHLLNQKRRSNYVAIYNQHKMFGRSLECDGLFFPSYHALGTAFMILATTVPIIPFRLMRKQSR